MVALLAATGGVPLFVRDILTYYRMSNALWPILERLRSACELFEDAQEAATQTKTLTHFDNVEDGLPELWLLQYVLPSADFVLTNSLRHLRCFWLSQLLDVRNTIFEETCGLPNPRRMERV